MIRRMRGRSMAELATRARQAVAARLGRVGIEPALRPTDVWLRDLDRPLRSATGLLEWLRTGAPSLVLGGAADPAETAAAVAAAHPGERHRLQAQVERIADGRFDLLGHRNLSFGDPIDWSLDPTTGVRAPDVHWSRIDHLDAGLVGDHKLIWELNRQQYLHLLARVCLLTEDSRYARLAIDHMDAWMRSNPPHVGINWSSSLELAYRSIAWLWTLWWLREEDLDPTVLARAIQFLELHGRHIATHLSTYYSPNTHLTGEALGLLYLGTLLPILPAAERWRRLGWDTLLSEIDRHVEPDGTYFERSTYYHRYTVDIYAHALLLGRERPEQEVDAVRDALDRLLDHSMTITRPDGGTPLVGDDDGGHLWMPRYDRPTDFRPSLSTGAVLLGRSDLAWVAGALDPETVWLLGPGAVQRWKGLDAEPPDPGSTAFPDGGYYVLRDGWSREARYMLVDAGPHGALNCGHAHADALSFELAAGGAPLLVDPGTCSYADAAIRDAFRAAGAHNTVTIDGQGASVPAGPFQWARITDVKEVRWWWGAAFDYVDGAVHVPAEGFRHRREVVFARGVGWLIRDRIDADEAAVARVVFQGVPGRMSPRTVEPGMVAVRFEPGNDGPRLDILSWGRDLTDAVSSRWVSPIHGRREAAPAWVVEAPAGQEIITLLLPAGHQQPPTVESDRSGHGLHLRFRLGDAAHEVRCGDGSTAFGSSGVETDARCMWRWTGEADGRLVVVDAHRLEIGGVARPLSDGEGPCAEARRSAGTWIMEMPSD